EFEAEDKLAIQEGAGSLPARLAILRNTLWEGTIERRNQAIGASSTRQKVQQTNDRSRALSLVVKKMNDEGLDSTLSQQEFELTANTRLKHLGFSPTASPPEPLAA
ncbi:hypothetical protein AB4586_20165, partial [Vibrio sp. 10N.222.49.E4]